MTLLKAAVLSLFCISTAIGLSGCEQDGASSSSLPTEWPPRLHQLDSQAASIPADAEVSWVIDPGKPLRWSGKQQLRFGRFVPIEDEFSIAGGELISRVGDLEKRATFGAWLPILRSAEGGQIGWGPCLTDGEVIVPNVFVGEESAEIWVDNRFEAEDLGEGHTLIRLHEEKGHRLCIWFRKPKQGQQVFGELGQSGDASVFGPLESSSLDAKYSTYRLGSGAGGVMHTGKPDTAPMLAFTFRAVGGQVSMGNWLLIHNPDGWYVGESKVSK